MILLGVVVQRHPRVSVQGLVQLEVLKLPAPPVAVNETDPAGVVAPAPLVSATVAVHCEGVPIGTLDGLQTIVVDVVRSVAVTVPLLAPLLELPA